MTTPLDLTPRRSPWRLGASGLLLVLGAALMAPHGDLFYPETLHRFWGAAAVMGVGFALSWGLRVVPLAAFWGVAVVTRLLLLPMHPGIDVWRYLWEGYIQTLGFSPYHFAPLAPALEPFRTDWWSQIVFPDVTAIYPPIAQLGFRGLAAIAPNLYLFKLAFALADLLVCGLLCHRFGPARTTLYAWNPLVIYAFAGGAHYDSWFILPLVAAWLLVESLDQTPPPDLWPWLGSALLLGVSIAVKWVSLPLLAWLVVQGWRQFKGWQAIALGLAGLLPVVLSALPFCGATLCPLVPTSSAFVAYGRSAELLPHLVAQVWPASLETNWIYGLPLGLVVVGLLWRRLSLQHFATGYWFSLFILSPIMHSWYFTWLVPFAVPSQNWGVRLGSLSIFVYFVLPSRVPVWQLTLAERLLLWLPFVLGWLWMVYHEAQRGKAEAAERSID